MLPPACSRQQANNPLPRVFTKENEQESFKAAFEKIWGPMEEIENLPLAPWMKSTAADIGTTSRPTFPSSSS